MKCISIQLDPLSHDQNKDDIHIVFKDLFLEKRTQI